MGSFPLYVWYLVTDPIIYDLPPCYLKLPIPKWERAITCQLAGRLVKTLPKTNSLALKKGHPQTETRIPTIHFWGAMLVLPVGRVIFTANWSIMIVLLYQNAHVRVDRAIF